MIDTRCEAHGLVYVIEGAARLRGKAQGLRLAVSFFEEAHRSAAPDVADCGCGKGDECQFDDFMRAQPSAAGEGER